MQTAIGDKKWRFSDDIFERLTGKHIASNYNPSLNVELMIFPNFIPEKNLFVIFWSTPTFKDVDSNYLFHVNDSERYDLVISTSSGNTVEGVARAIMKYNKETDQNKKALLLVPEISSYKVSKSVTAENPYILYIVLKNSTLDSTREYSKLLHKQLSQDIKIITADDDLKTAAYSQIGLILKENNLLNSNTCYIQTVSGGVGPAGLMEASKTLGEKPSFMMVQPKETISGPTIQALNEHSSGRDPFAIFEKIQFKTPSIEPTLGSTRPFYALKKFIEWRENKGMIYTGEVTEKDLENYRDNLCKKLIEAGIYYDVEESRRFFDIEKSGFIALTAASLCSDNIPNKNIVVNFTGRRPSSSEKFTFATPHLAINPSREDLNEITDSIRKKIGFL